MAYSITLARIVEKNEMLDHYQVIRDEHRIWAAPGYCFVDGRNVYLAADTVPDVLRRLRLGMLHYGEKFWGGQIDFVAERRGESFEQLDMTETDATSLPSKSSVIRLALL